MNFDLLAKYYDILHSQLEEDLPLWETLTQEADGSILEIGCGTGRLPEQRMLLIFLLS